MERIELHARTNMTVMDGIASAENMIKVAIAMGQKSIAICDANTVLSYPYIINIMQALEQQKAKVGAKLDFKVIYGVEVNVLDDSVPPKQDVLPEYYDYSAVLLLKKWDKENVIYRLLSEANAYRNNEILVVLKSELEKYRDNFLIGSPDDNGEIWLSLAFGEDVDIIAKKMSFYDYVELMPADYLKHWIIEEAGMCEDIQVKQKRLLAIAEQLGKPVIATNHPTLLNYADFEARAQLVNCYHRGKADAYYPCFLLKSNDLKKQFSYLDEKCLQTIVMDNPKRIAEQCTNVQPPERRKHFPHNIEIEQELVLHITDAAKKTYGNAYSEEIKNRIQVELHMLKAQEELTVFAAMVKICDYSKEQGYQVQVRGMLGNLVIAYLTGLVNTDPLQYKLPWEEFFELNNDKSPYFELRFATEIYADIMAQLAKCFPAGQLVKGSAVRTLLLEDKPTTDVLPDIRRFKDNVRYDLEHVRIGWKQLHWRILIVPDKAGLYEYMPVRKHFNNVCDFGINVYTGIEVENLDGIYASVNLGILPEEAKDGTSLSQP